MASRPRLDMTRAEIDELLALRIPGVLSTIGSGGVPHSAGMYFVRNDDVVEMWTYAKSQKAVNLRRDPRCSFLVEHGEPYRDLRGVLLRTEADLITGVNEIARIGRALYDRYWLPKTGVRLEDGPGREIDRQALKRVGIALALEQIASWDHAKA